MDGYRAQEVVGEVRNILRPLTAGKRLHMEVEIDSRLGEVTVDPAKLKQVLYNYLSNAIKFTPEEGQVTIRLRAEGEDTFHLEVEDSGIGIQPRGAGDCDHPDSRKRGRDGLSHP